MESTNEKTSKRKIIWTICALLVIICGIMQIIMGIGKIVHIPTGNIAMFYLDSKINDLSDNEIPEDLSDNENELPLLGDEKNDSSKPNLDKKLIVRDKNANWNAQTKLNIFENPAYEMREKVAPGCSNSYEFYIINTNKFNIKHTITFLEINPMNVNMKYKLRENGKYIAGSEDKWLSYDELKSTNIVTANGQTKYFLDWKWIESDNDTEIGASGDVKYILNINIYAEQI